MIYIFTRSDKWGSRLISWGTNSPMSHMLVAKRAENDSPVVESTFPTGVWQTTLKEALEHREVVLALRVKNLTKGKLDELFLNVQKLIGEHYDWKGIAWWTVAIVWFNKILRRKLPRENKWADKEDFYCSELVYANEAYLQGWVAFSKYGRQMLDPKRAAEILGNSALLEIVDLKLEMKLNE